MQRALWILEACPLALQQPHCSLEEACSSALVLLQHHTTNSSSCLYNTTEKYAAVNLPENKMCCWCIPFCRSKGKTKLCNCLSAPCIDHVKARRSVHLRLPKKTHLLSLYASANNLTTVQKLQRWCKFSRQWQPDLMLTWSASKAWRPTGTPLHLISQQAALKQRAETLQIGTACQARLGLMALLSRLC